MAEEKKKKKDEVSEPTPSEDLLEASLDRLQLKEKLQEALRHLKNVHGACELLALRLIDRDNPGNREV